VNKFFHFLSLKICLKKRVMANGTGLKESSTPLWTLVGIVTVRYIFLPLLGVAAVKAAIHLSLVPSDPLYQFVLLLQHALPPAMNIGIFPIRSPQKKVTFCTMIKAVLKTKMCVGRVSEFLINLPSISRSCHFLYRVFVVVLRCKKMMDNVRDFIT